MNTKVVTMKITVVIGMIQMVTGVHLLIMYDRRILLMHGERSICSVG